MGGVICKKWSMLSLTVHVLLGDVLCSCPVGLYVCVCVCMFVCTVWGGGMSAICAHPGDALFLGG